MHGNPNDILPGSWFSFSSPLFSISYPLVMPSIFFYFSHYWLWVCTPPSQIPNERSDGMNHSTILLSGVLQLDTTLALSQYVDGFFWVGHTFFGLKSCSQSWGGWLGTTECKVIYGWRTTLKGAMGLAGTPRLLRRVHYLACLIESYSWKWVKLQPQEIENLRKSSIFSIHNETMR